MTRAASLLLILGIFAPAAAWFAAQQGQGAVVYFHCAAAGPPVGPLLGLAALAVCSAAAWLGWRRRRAASQTTRMLAQVALGLASIFALAALVSVAATLAIPPCAR